MQNYNRQREHQFGQSMRQSSLQPQPLKRRVPSFGLRMLAAVALTCLCLASTGIAQDETVYGVRDKSQAQKEADRLVTLSPEKVIDILSNEPGLLLQVKKRMVKLAFEQGRILDEQDLTDESLYRLIREDTNIRNIATREIEDRNYIRPKPTREELDEQRRMRELRELEGMTATTANPPAAGAATPGQASQKKVSSQEDEYWQRHEQDDQLVPTPRRTTPQTGAPRDGYPEPTGPASRERILNRADARDRDKDADNPFELMSPATSRMARARAEDLPSLAAGAAQARYSEDESSAGYISGQQGSSRKLAPESRAGADMLASRDLNRGRSSDLTRGTLSDRDRGTSPGYRNNPPYPQEPVSSDANVRHAPNPYADVPSLYDLYSQVTRRQPKPERFGMDIFTNGTGNFDDLPMDMPVGPEYVLGPGDMVKVEMSGGVTDGWRLVVGREGRIILPDVGPVMVAGRSLGDAQRAVQAELRTQFRDVQADLSLARLRTVRVNVVGDVQNPGPYDISALSTPLNAIYTAGGPTARGSLRNIQHLRGSQVVAQYDAYDLLLHGVRGDVKTLQPGDTIKVPPLGAQVTVEGGVRRPAIYELRGEKNLAEVLELAGGILNTGTLRHVEVDRLVAHEGRTMLNLDVPETNNSLTVDKKLTEFKVQDGDRIRIALIPAYTEKTIYLDGHVFQPSKYAWREGMKVSDALTQYTSLLPEPDMRHAEIIRLDPKNFSPSVISVNLGNALAHGDQDVALQPFDTLRVFGRFDFEDPPIITVAGEVRHPGDHRTNGVTHVTDAVFLAGGFTSDAAYDEAQIVRRTGDTKVKVLSVNLRKALEGDPAENVLLQPKDRVIIHRDLAKLDPATVVVGGEVGKPGKYPLGTGMTVSDLVRTAGGLKRSADTGSADLARFVVTNGQKVEGDHQLVEISKALSGDATSDVLLKDGDVLSIRQLTGWQDRGATITLHGEVMYPGTYGIREGERLSSILRRAGGLRATAYPYGALLQREQVRQLEERNQIELIRRVQSEENNIKGIQDNILNPHENEAKLARDSAMAQWEATLEKLKTSLPLGRMEVHIPADLRHWEGTSADVEVRAGDVLTIPKRPSFVMITGSVYNPTAVSYRPGKSADWYLRQSGGPTNLANKHAIFVIRADGTAANTGSSMWSGNLLGVSLKPGDMVVVPEKAVGGSPRWKSTLESAQIITSIVEAAVLTTRF